VIVHYIVYSVLAALTRDSAPAAGEPDEHDEHPGREVTGRDQRGPADSEHRDTQ
jgi:hypothetical protein